MVTPCSRGSQQPSDHRVEVESCVGGEPEISRVARVHLTRCRVHAAVWQSSSRDHVECDVRQPAALAEIAVERKGVGNVAREIGIPASDRIHRSGLPKQGGGATSRGHTQQRIYPNCASRCLAHVVAVYARVTPVGRAVCRQQPEHTSRCVVVVREEGEQIGAAVLLKAREDERPIRDPATLLVADDVDRSSRGQTHAEHELVGCVAVDHLLRDRRTNQTPNGRSVGWRSGGRATRRRGLGAVNLGGIVVARVEAPNQVPVRAIDQRALEYAPTVGDSTIGSDELGAIVGASQHEPVRGIRTCGHAVAGGVERPHTREGERASHSGTNRIGEATVAGQCREQPPTLVARQVEYARRGVVGVHIEHPGLLKGHSHGGS